MTNKILYLAPIRGVTNSIYRNAFHKYFNNFDLAITPFIPTFKGEKAKPKTLKDVLPQNNNAMELIPQIIGNNSEDIIFLAEELYNLGYKEINLNFGCPHKMVAKRGRGSGILPFPEKVDNLLKEIIPNIRAELSIKTRLGRESTKEIFQLIPIFNSYNLKEITIHPRTGVQMYSGKVFIEEFGKALELLEHSVVYNGDIFYKEDFENLQTKFPQINKWMLGRGALVNPFLPAEIKEKTLPSNDEKVELLRKFHNEVYNNYKEVLFGPASLLGKMKEFWFYLSHIFYNNKKLLKQIQKCSSEKKYEDVINSFFESADIIDRHNFN